MEISKVTELLLCPACRKAGMTLNCSALICECGANYPIHGNRIDFETLPVSDEWQAQQDAALTEYHGDDYNADLAQPQLFGNFMAVTLDRGSTVLDIGCGIGTDLPPYVDQLGLTDYVGLEPFQVEVAPDYPMLAGAVAEKLPLKDDSIDAAIFATSMDHIEGIDEAMAEVRRVLKPEGSVYIWQGLYDPDTIAKMKTFDVIWRGSLVRRAARFLAAQVEYAHTLWKMADRRKRLASGARIDPYHCRWYTRERIAADLKRWGFTPRRTLEVPNSPSLFVEAVIG